MRRAARRPHRARGLGRSLLVCEVHVLCLIPLSPPALQLYTLVQLVEVETFKGLGTTEVREEQE